MFFVTETLNRPAINICYTFGETKIPWNATNRLVTPKLVRNEANLQ